MRFLGPGGGAGVVPPERFVGRGGTTQVITGVPQPIVNLSAPFGGKFGGTPFSPGAGLGNIDPMVARAILGQQLGLQAGMTGQRAPLVTAENQTVLSGAVAQGAPLSLLNQIPASGLPGGDDDILTLAQLRRLLRNQ